MTEQTETSDLTVEDVIEQAKDAKYHTVLEIWQKLLKDGISTRKDRITPQWAHRIVSSYPEIGYHDVPDFADIFYDRLGELLTVVEIEIDDDPETFFAPDTPEEDDELNSTKYVNIISDWQKTMLSWELEWDVLSGTAALEFATIVEIHKMVFGENGLIGLLDAIGFEFNDMLVEVLQHELDNFKKSYESEG